MGGHAVTDASENKVTSGIGVLNPFRYRGYYYDTETGLYYLQTRYYDPETGRFISADRIEYLDPETLGGLNLYAYCANNPIMFVDPLGKFGLLTALFAFLIFTAVCVTTTAVVGGVSAAINHENVWQGIGKGALLGSMISGSVGLVLFGLTNPLVDGVFGSTLVGAAVGSAFALSSNLDAQLKNGSIASLDLNNLASSWGIGLGVGAVAGGLSYGAKEVGQFFGELLGMALPSKTFLGITISKVISSETLGSLGQAVGGLLGGFLAGSIINNFATNAGWQNQNLPLWIGSILKLIFKK